MEIVINIPEKVYSYVNTQWRDILKNDSPISIMCNAVIDGTPLPKGHGDLIDRSTLEPDTEWSDWDDGLVSYSYGQIAAADVVIEADKEDK